MEAAIYCGPEVVNLTLLSAQAEIQCGPEVIDLTLLSTQAEEQFDQCHTAQKSRADSQ